MAVRVAWRVLCARQHEVLTASLHIGGRIKPPHADFPEVRPQHVIEESPRVHSLPYQGIRRPLVNYT